MKRLLVILIFTCACYFSHAQVNIITTIAGSDTPAYCCDNGPAINAYLNRPDQLWLDKFGNLYIADDLNNRVRKIVLATGIITTVAGNGTFGYSGDGMQATDATLWEVTGVCTDNLGNVYISDGLNSRIRKVTIATGIISTIAGNGTIGNSGDGEPATNAQIYGPQGITIDKFGNIYFADYFNNNIRKIDISGIITTIAGTGTQGYSGDGALATNAELYEPGHVAIDSSENVIVTDYGNHAVRKINSITGIINTIAGNGSPNYTGDGGPAIHATMSYPYGIFIDRVNNIFVVEGGNAVVRRIDGLTGIISTVAGCGTIGFGGDGGPATAAELQPDDVWIDSIGTMYIADFSNNRIRKVYNSKLATPDVIATHSVNIYPNPASDESTIENAVASEMRIYDLLGRVMMSSKVISDKEPFSIRSLHAGSYIVYFTSTSGEVQKLRLIKE